MRLLWTEGPKFLFECSLDAAQCKLLDSNLLKLINLEKHSIRFYYLGNKNKTKIEHFGAKSTYDPDEVLMI